MLHKNDFTRKGISLSFVNKKPKFAEFSWYLQFLIGFKEGKNWHGSNLKETYLKGV